MLLDEIRDYLVSQGAVYAGGTVHIPELPPSTPNDAIAINDYAGEPPVEAKGSAQPIALLPRFRVIVRGTTYLKATRQAQIIKQELAGFGAGQISGVYYAWIRPLGEPFFFGLDGSNRTRIVCNYEACKAESPTD